jgi:hypothetical protein
MHPQSPKYEAHIAATSPATIIPNPIPFAFATPGLAAAAVVEEEEERLAAVVVPLVVAAVVAAVPLVDDAVAEEPVAVEAQVAV